MISVAVDGPAGAGKSSISRAAAKKLSYVYVDTGALYRAVGLCALEHHIVPSDAEGVSQLLEGLNIEFRYNNQNDLCVMLNGRDVSALIRTPEVSMAASDVSALPQVRTFLLETQRRLARENDVIMDGRDIGTVVLPDATVKVFLTASPEIRAQRRLKELVEKGTKATFEQVLEEMKIRDYNDSHRAIAPLKPAPNAVQLDTTELNFEQSVQALMDIIQEQGKKGGAQ